MHKVIGAVLLSFLVSANALSVERTEQEKTDLKGKVVTVQKEMDQLVHTGGRYAYVQLSRKNGLSPFAIGVETNGNTLILEIPKENQKREVTLADKIVKLREMLKLAADNNKITSGALFIQAQVPHLGKMVPGVAIEMEHKLGMSFLRFSPYEIDRENQKIEFKKPSDQIKPLVFFKDAKEVHEAS
ncbi:MAG: hypothetical protein V7785_03270 [Bermanella sp.]